MFLKSDPALQMIYDLLIKSAALLCAGSDLNKNSIIFQQIYLVALTIFPWQEAPKTVSSFNQGS